jgi:hypothetical protein
MPPLPGCAPLIFHTCGDEILTYGYVKPWDLWFLTKETPRPTPLESLGGSGAIPTGYAHAHAQTKELAQA